MKKSTKMTLMAGLLITPAIVAQAGEVQAIGEETAVETKTEIEKLKDLAQKLIQAKKEALTKDTIETYKLDVANAITALSTATTTTKNTKIDIGNGQTKTINEIITAANKELIELNTLVTTITSFETKAKNKTFTTATKYSTEAKSIETAVGKLAPYQKLFISNLDKATYIFNAEKVVTSIAGLDAKIAYNTAEYRGKVTDARVAFDSLNKDNEQPLVYNVNRLSEIEAIIKEVEAIEDKVIDNAEISAITSTVNTYNALTPTSKRNYILADKKTTLDVWKNAVTTAATVEKQIQAISTEPFAKLGSITDATKKTTVEAFVNNTIKAQTAYNNLGPTEAGKVDLKQLVSSGSRIVALNEVAKVANSVISFSVYSSSDAQQVEAVEAELNNFDVNTENFKALTTVEKQDIQKLKEYLTDYLNDRKKEQTTIKEIDALITRLKTSGINSDDLVNALELYNGLSKEAKPYVSDYAYLQNLNTQYKAAINIVNTINSFNPEAKDFPTKVKSAKTAYDNLTSSLKAAVSNYSTLEGLVPITQLMQDINSLKATATTFRTDIAKARESFNTYTANVTVPSIPSTGDESSSGEGGSTTGNEQTTDKILEAKQELLKTYGPKLAELEVIIKAADDMMTKINQLSTKKGKEFMDELSVLSEQYKGLDSTIKKNITNAKTLTDLEKDYKSSLKVVTLIEQLPANTDKNFSSKVASAEKAYQNLTAKQKEDVYNYEKIQAVLKAADLIARIEKLKIGAKTFDADLNQLRQDYDALTDTEKALVHNVSKITEAEGNRKLAEDVVALINQAEPTAENYIAKLTAARKAYDDLDKTQQKLVTNIKDLTSRERTVKPILKLDDDILKLDPSNAKTFISKFKSAEKAYDKLSIAERTLLLNAEKFTGELRTIYKVIDAINAIKASSKTFVDDVKKARTLFENLPDEMKVQISNLSVLEDHELNVLGGSRVDALISGLSSVNASEYITKVKDARAAYKALSSANKKAVTLEKELKAIEKYISPVEKVITEIEGLTNPNNNLSNQFAKVNKSLQKLDEKQRSYITNMDKYSNLTNVTHVYDLIEKLKPSDRYYQGNLEAAKLAYDKLSQDEKLKVTNYYKLQEAQMDVDEAKNMMNMIASLSEKSSTYFVDIEKALAAYKEIPSGLKKQVTNYDKLKEAEKNMKAVQKVITQIDAIDPLAKNYASKAKSALKAYNKLTEEQKALVSNFDRLQEAVNELGL
jgi:hypothetical protein